MNITLDLSLKHMLNSFIYTTSQVFLAKGSPVKCRTFVFLSKSLSLPAYCCLGFITQKTLCDNFYILKWKLCWQLINLAFKLFLSGDVWRFGFETCSFLCLVCFETGWRKTRLPNHMKTPKTNVKLNYAHAFI